MSERNGMWGVCDACGNEVDVQPNGKGGGRVTLKCARPPAECEIVKLFALIGIRYDADGNMVKN